MTQRRVWLVPNGNFVCLYDPGSQTNAIIVQVTDSEYKRIKKIASVGAYVDYLLEKDPALKGRFLPYLLVS